MKPAADLRFRLFSRPALGLAVSLAAMVLLLSGLAGCDRLTGKAPEVIGAPITLELTPIADILTSPQDFDSQQVAVRGVIGSVCPTGCWFDLQDRGALVRVDLHPAGLAIPQRAGSSATVQGTVSVIDRRVVIRGAGVTFQ